MELHSDERKMGPDGQIRSALHFPYEIVDVDEDINTQLLKDFSGERTNFVQVGPKKYFFPRRFKEYYNELYNFEVRPDDVWIVTFPRSGTTWTQEMAWLLVNNLDFDTAHKVPLTERSPFLEFSIFVHDDVKKEFFAENADSIEKLAMVDQVTKHGWEILNETKTRRVIKTHLPFSLLPPNLLSSGCKIIYVARNPKDVAVSFYYLNRLIRTQGYSGDFHKYWHYFQNNLQPWTPYWEHIKEGWSKRSHENVLFMFYENMNKDLRASLKSIAAFLDQDVSSEGYDRMVEHLKIDNFRNNSSVNCAMLKNLGILIADEQGFVRNGKNGSWRDRFDDELEDIANKWIDDNLRDTDIEFPK